MNFAKIFNQFITESSWNILKINRGLYERLSINLIRLRGPILPIRYSETINSSPFCYLLKVSMSKFFLDIDLK